MGTFGVKRVSNDYFCPSTVLLARDLLSIYGKVHDTSTVLPTEFPEAGPVEVGYPIAQFGQKYFPSPESTTSQRSIATQPSTSPSIFNTTLKKFLYDRSNINFYYLFCNTMNLHFLIYFWIS